jgi:hypothetical protein
MIPLQLVYLATFGLLVCFWIKAKVPTSTKILLTGLYLACWGIGWMNAFFGAAAQCLLALALIGLTFGIDWLMRRH